MTQLTFSFIALESEPRQGLSYNRTVPERGHSAPLPHSLWEEDTMSDTIEPMLIAKILSRLGMLQHARSMTLPQRRKVLAELAELLTKLPVEVPK